MKLILDVGGLSRDAAVEMGETVAKLSPSVKSYHVVSEVRLTPGNTVTVETRYAALGIGMRHQRIVR